MILHTVPAGPGLALFKIEGQLDFAGAPTVRTALARAADAAHHGRMVINLADVNEADDKGVASLAAAIRRLVAQYPAMRVATVARDRRLAEALGDRSVRVYETDRAAWRSVQAESAA